MTPDFDNMICDPIRCNATAAEILSFDFGAWTTLIILICSLVAGIRLSRNDRLLPVLLLIAVSPSFFSWYERNESQLLSRAGIERSVHARYVGWDEADAIVGDRRFDIETHQKHWRTQAFWAWLELSILPFALGWGGARAAIWLRPRK